MKRWRETQQVLDRLEDLAAAGRRAALATVVRVWGSAYRREGAKMLVADDGSTVGNVSGGCLEADVREVALEVLKTGVPQLRSYCSGSEEIAAWDLGVGCDGQVDVYIEPVSEARDDDRAMLSQVMSFAVCTLISNGTPPRAERLIVMGPRTFGTLGTVTLDRAASEKARALIPNGESGMLEAGGEKVFVDVFISPPRLVIVSAGDDARAFANLAMQVGFEVVVIDWRPAMLDASRFATGVKLVYREPDTLEGFVSIDDRTFVVMMTHNFARDEQYLRVFIKTPARYIGVLGPRRRTERLLKTVCADERIAEAKVYGPVGLDIGAEGAEQVAVAVLGELLAVQSGRRAVSLRERLGPIHVDDV